MKRENSVTNSVGKCDALEQKLHRLFTRGDQSVTVVRKGRRGYLFKGDYTFYGSNKVVIHAPGWTFRKMNN